MNKYIDGKTVHQLSEDEFNALKDTRAGAAKKALIAQKAFEEVVIQRGWFFHDTYHYTGTDKHVVLVSPLGKGYSTQPGKFKRGGGAKFDFDTERRQFLYNMPEADLKAYIEAQPKQTISMLKKQLEFEQEAIRRGWGFPESYRYSRVTEKVELVAPVGVQVTVQPQFFLKGGYEQYQVTN